MIERKYQAYFRVLLKASQMAPEFANAQNAEYSLELVAFNLARKIILQNFSHVILKIKKVL